MSRHNTIDSCWIIVENMVLDVTGFIEYHPGSENAIVKWGGTHCDRHFHFHSPKTRKFFFKFVIGRIIPKDGDQACIVM